MQLHYIFSDFKKYNKNFQNCSFLFKISYNLFTFNMFILRFKTIIIRDFHMLNIVEFFRFKLEKYRCLKKTRIVGYSNKYFS